MKHTPGPWTAYPMLGCIMISNHKGEFIEYAMNGSKFEGEVAANAILIAAAPMMLEALRLILPTLTNKTLKAIITEVIVKAEGGPDGH